MRQGGGLTESYHSAPESPALVDLLAQFVFRLPWSQDEDLVYWLQMGEQSVVVLLHHWIPLSIYAVLRPATARSVRNRSIVSVSFKGKHDGLMVIDPYHNVTRRCVYRHRSSCAYADQRGDEHSNRRQ